MALGFYVNPVDRRQKNKHYKNNYDSLTVGLMV